MPAFSVIVPTRNRPAMLERALRSILAQTFRDYDVIVADDGAGDGISLARSVFGGAFAGLETGGLGQVPARNMALRQATGRWIAYLDDDDWWAGPDYLGRLAGVLQTAGGLAYASGKIVRETAALETLDQIPFQAFIDRQSIRRDNTLLVSGIAYDRALHDRLGLFDESLAVYWDWDWYLRLAGVAVPFSAIDEDGVRISARVDNVSSPGNEALRSAELLRLCAKHGLTGIVLKNHESIAIDQQGQAIASPVSEAVT